MGGRGRRNQAGTALPKSPVLSHLARAAPWSRAPGIVLFSPERLQGARTGYKAHPRSQPAVCSGAGGCRGALRRRAGLGKVSAGIARRGRQGGRGGAGCGSGRRGHGEKEEPEEEEREQGQKDRRASPEASDAAPLLWKRSSRRRGGGRGGARGAPASRSRSPGSRPHPQQPPRPPPTHTPLLPLRLGLGGCGLALQGCPQPPASSRALSCQLGG